MNEILNLDATDQLLLLKTKKISARELMIATLDRINSINPTVNAIIAQRDPDILIKEADSSLVGPLAGLPIAIKDLEETKDVVTTFGSPLFKHFKPTHDSTMVQKLKEAGAIIIGKTNVPEFGLGSNTYNPVYGKTLNPYNLSKSAGGSSGGAAVALATRMLTLADGSDMMGSLRNPAGWNNVYGFRPSFGLVPASKEKESFFTQLSTKGPMARSIRDLELLLSIQTAFDAKDPHSTGPYSKSNKNIGNLKIGWIADWGGAYKTDPKILELCEKALKEFEKLGHNVIKIDPPFSATALWKSWTTLRSWSILGTYRSLYEDASSKALLKPAVIWEVESALGKSAEDIFRASEIRSEWFRKTAESEVDIMALPSAQIFPFDSEIHWPKEILGTKMDTYHRWMEVVIPASLTGLPALSVPVGFGPENTPIGMQLFGHRRKDAIILALAKQYETKISFTSQKPNLQK